MSPLFVGGWIEKTKGTIWGLLSFGVKNIHSFPILYYEQTLSCGDALLEFQSAKIKKENTVQGVTWTFPSSKNFMTP